LSPLRRDRRVGERRDCGEKRHADPHDKVGRLSPLTNDDPLFGDGTGAPVGAGTSRDEEVSNVFGRASTVELLEMHAKHVAFCTNTQAPAPGLWYGPPVLGQAQTPRRRVLPLVAFA